MEKKINYFIKDVLIKQDFNELNYLIEKNCLNSGVLIFVNFFTYKNYLNELSKLKQTSLNYLNIQVVYNYENSLKFNDILNETYSMVVGIGDFKLFEFTQKFAIKNNINYSFVCNSELKSEFFYNFYAKKQDYYSYFSPTFIYCLEKKLSNKEKSNLYFNIYKYLYLFIENELAIEKSNNLENFLKDYVIILNNLNEKNLINSCVSLGLILNKYKIKYFYENNNKSEILEFYLSLSLILLYKNIFKVLNVNNLILNRNYLNYNENKLIKYYETDFNFYKFFLINNKKNILNKICLVEDFYNKVSNKILKMNPNFIYKKIKSLNENVIIKNLLKSSCNLFLNNMENFELFSF